MGLYSNAPFTVTHRNGSVATTLVLLNNQSTTCILKYTARGEFIQAIQFRGYNGLPAFAIGPDESIVSYMQIIQFGSTWLSMLLVGPKGETLINRTSTGTDVRVIFRIDKNGTLQWTSEHVGMPEWTPILQMKFDSTGSLLIAGSYKELMQIYHSDATLAVNITGEWPSAFVAKYTDRGWLQWMYRVGTGTLVGHGIGIDPTNNDVRSFRMRQY
jgi:hypothetical protein